MKIAITGFNGIYTGASIKAFVGMVFQGKIVTKVNEKSVLLAKADEQGQAVEDTEQKVDELSLPFWALSPLLAHDITTPDGRRYQPSDLETALQTLCNADADDAVTAIGAVAERFVKAGTLQKQPIRRFDGLSAGTVLTVIDQMMNH